MKLRLKSWKVTSLTFAQTDEKDLDRENSFDLESGNYFSENEDDNQFGVGFKAIIKDKLFDLELEAIFDFEVMDGKISDEFKLSSFPKINAPAIAFPYLRSFISIFTLQSGFNPVMLPSINFTKSTSEDDSTE